jgi:hypothetical protein
MLSLPRSGFRGNGPNRASTSTGVRCSGCEVRKRVRCPSRRAIDYAYVLGKIGRTAESGGLSPFLWAGNVWFPPQGRDGKRRTLAELTQPAAVSLNGLWSSYGSAPPPALSWSYRRSMPSKFQCTREEISPPTVLIATIARIA